MKIYFIIAKYFFEVEKVLFEKASTQGIKNIFSKRFAIAENKN